MASIEAQSQYIIKEIVTWDQYAWSITHKQNESDSKWASARLSVELLEKIGDELDKAAIREAVGELYGVVGGTIRRREKAASVVSEAIVDLHPGIGFTHWRTAVDAKHIEDPLAAALEVIGWMYDYKNDPDRGAGRFPTVATVDGWVYGEGGKAAEVWRSRSDSITDQMGKVFHDRHTPFVMRMIIGYCRGLIRQFLDDGTNPLEEMQRVPGDPRTMSKEEARRRLEL